VRPKYDAGAIGTIGRPGAFIGACNGDCLPEHWLASRHGLGTIETLGRSEMSGQACDKSYLPEQRLVIARAEALIEHVKEVRYLIKDRLRDMIPE